MSKKHNKWQNTQLKPVAPPTQPPLSNIINEAAKLQSEGLAAAPDTPPPPPAPPEINLAEAINQARHAREAFTKAKENLSDREIRVSKREDDAEKKSDATSKRTHELDDREERLDQREVSMRASEKSLQTERDDLAKKKTEFEKSLVDREESLKAREADAVAGFLARKREMLAQVDAELKRQAEASASLEKTRLDEQADYAKRLINMREEALSGLAEERSKLREQQTQLQQAQREANWATADADDLKQNYEKRLADALKLKEVEFTEQREAAAEQVSRLSRLLAEKDAAEHASGGRSVKELTADLDRLRAERAKLQEELSRRASDEQTKNLHALESDKEALSAALEEARRQLKTLEGSRARQNIAVGELEILEMEKRSLEMRNGAFKAAIGQLEDDLGRLTEKSQNKSVFPELIRLDENPELQRPPVAAHDTPLTDLKAIADYVRMSMARGGEKEPPLFYNPNSIRCFLGGLASNRLHLLQGISGTGKSSLPRAFARVLGWTSAFVEVQSSWRDKSDLLGYYNAFDKRFYESGLLKALYKAHCPSHAAHPFFIVLDEMNLAQTEHYFADFLSALEQTNPSLRRVLLQGQSLSASPRYLAEDGTAIRIPDNLWFIGTANHDESTKDFADKTYDRAHVMELPRAHQPFKPEPPKRPPPPLAWADLKALFDAAVSEKSGMTEDPLQFLKKHLSVPLAEVDLGWGNRFEKQLGDFLPVVVAAGGTPTEALDHLLATKLLRKLRGRFDLPSSEVDALRSKMESAWKVFAKEHQPTVCLEILASESKRLGQR